MSSSLRAADDSDKAVDRARDHSGSTSSFIDQLIEEAWKKAGVKPARPGVRRRIPAAGLPRPAGPNSQRARGRAFLQLAKRTSGTKLVEYLLDHPDFAKNFATQWTVLLIGRGNQGRMVDRASLTNWLRKQFARIGPGTRSSTSWSRPRAPTRRTAPSTYVLAHLEFEAVPLTSRTTRLFLGQQIQCTQCHDHPSNDWKQADFWGINAFFKGIKTEEVRKAERHRAGGDDHTELRDEPTDAYVQLRQAQRHGRIAFPRFLDGRKISQGTDVIRRAELGKLIADPKNEMLAKAFVNRMWAHFLGRGFVNPVDDFGPHNPPSHPELLDQLAKDFQKSGYDVKKLCRWIMASQAYQLSSIRKAKGSEKDERLFSHDAAQADDPRAALRLAADGDHGASGRLGRRRQPAARRLAAAVPLRLRQRRGRGIDQLPGDDPPGADDDERRADADGALGQAGQLPGRRHRAGPAASDGRPKPYMVDSIYLAALSRHPIGQRARPEPGSISNRTPTASRSCKTCSGLCSIPTSSS